MPNLLDPALIREAARRSVAEREAPILQWLNVNLEPYRLMTGIEIIRIIRSEVPEARNFATIELQSIIRRVANQKGFPPPLMQNPQAAQRPSIDLSRFTQFEFKLGATSWDIEIPSSLKGRLPVELQGARKVTFSLTASTSGSFEFAIELDASSHVKIRASAGVDVAGNQATTGLRIISRSTVCRAQDPQIARRNIIAKGKELTKAVNELQTPSEPEPGKEPLSELERMEDVVSAIADLYDAVDKAKAPCKQVPAFSVGLETQTPLDRDKAREEQQGSFFGVTLTVSY